MYRDVWDQKPPGIALNYAPLLTIWPGEAVVPGADLAAAAVVAILLVALGRRRYSPAVGFGAAAVFLLFRDPYLQRLSGFYVRGQCEPFIALAVTASLVLLAHRTRRPLHLIGAVSGWRSCSGSNTTLLPTPCRSHSPHGCGGQTRRRPAVGTGRSILVGIGFVAVSAALILYFSVTGALADLRLATIDDNLQVSNETYGGPFSVVSYLATFPFQRARVDMLWFLGGVGALLLAGRSWAKPSTGLVLTWVLAAVISIAVNGSRGLPNYFVQANPALALAASAGLATLVSYGVLVRFATASRWLRRCGESAPIRRSGGCDWRPCPG